MDVNNIYLLMVFAMFVLLASAPNTWYFIVKALLNSSSALLN